MDHEFMAKFRCVFSFLLLSDPVNRRSWRDEIFRIRHILDCDKLLCDVPIRLNGWRLHCTDNKRWSCQFEHTSVGSCHCQFVNVCLMPATKHKPDHKIQQINWFIQSIAIFSGDFHLFLEIKMNLELLGECSLDRSPYIRCIVAF